VRSAAILAADARAGRLKDSSCQQKWNHILPKWHMLRIPTSVSTVVEPESRVCRCRGEPLSFFPGNKLIIAAMNDHYRPVEIVHRRKIVEVTTE